MERHIINLVAAGVLTLWLISCMIITVVANRRDKKNPPGPGDVYR